MKFTTSPILCVMRVSAAMSSLVTVASSAALRTVSFACASWRLISLIEADSSSAAAATVSTSPQR
jgi:hypothetical protein